VSTRNIAVDRLEAAIGARLVLLRANPHTPPARLSNRYEVRAILGSGSFGTVVRAWDPNVAREVAIKCIPTDDPQGAFETFAPEARALAKVEAPEVVRLYDFFPTSIETGSSRLPCLAIVMELVLGINLRRWALSSREPDARLATLLSAAKGLEAAHAVGIVHRDFKPENVVITEQSLARLVDFGLAYRAGNLPSSKQLALRGEFGVGTLGYMAPEVFDGAITAASDQFAFAVTAWEVLTGSRPFDPQTQKWRSAKPSEFTGADQLPRQLRATLGRALRYAQQERFATICELRSALEHDGGFGRLAAFVVGGAVAVGAATTAYIARKNRHDPKQ
jgi:serine/threonine protein kinase